MQTGAESSMGRKLKPTKSDARRMYLRGATRRSIKVTAKTLEDALKPASPKAATRTASKPLKAKKPAQVSGIQVLSKAQVEKADRKSLANWRKKRPKKNKSNKKASVQSATPVFEGTPRFEGGYRFVQGGLPELGKRH
jgi:hypothetical protein